MAGATLLNNKAAQIDSELWGVHYPHNCLDATQLEAEGALSTGVFASVTRPGVYSAVAAVHACIEQFLGNEGQAGVVTGGSGMVWCGVDFLLGRAGEPCLLEFNVKPCARYMEEEQFDSPIAGEIARDAIHGFVKLMTSEATGVDELQQQPSNDSACWVRVDQQQCQ